MIYNFSNFFFDKIGAYLNTNPNNKNINDIVKEFSNSKKIAIPNQVHSCVVKDVEKEGVYSDVDGLITSKKDLILTLKVADCVPIFLYDDNRKNFGLIHSGWRGTAGNIISNGIQKMVDYKSNLNDIMVLIGPSIQSCCYEVDEDVASHFADNTKLKKENNKWMLNLQKQINNDLLDLSLNKKNIKLSDVCTHDTDECHSFRRDGTSAGRMIAVMGMIN